MGERASLQQARYRVILKSLPADDATLGALRELLRTAGLGDDEISRGFAHVPFPVATGVTADRAREVAGALARAGGDVEIVSPPLAAPPRSSAAERMVRSRKSDTRVGWYVLAAIVVVGAVAWVLVPSTHWLTLRPKPGDTLVFRRSIELDQSTQRQGALLTAKGSVRYDIVRKVVSATHEDVVVADRFRDVVFDLEVSGDGAAGYQTDLDATKQQMAEVEITRTFSANGKLRESKNEGPLLTLDPYPGFVDLMLGEMSFPPSSIKPGVPWDSAIDLEWAIRFEPERIEKHLGTRTVPAQFETVKMAKSQSSTMFANSGNKLDLAGRVWFDASTGVPVDVQADLRRTRFAQGAGNYNMDTIQARVTQALVR